MVPSAWASSNPELSLPSQDMPILTNDMKEMITKVARINVKSELVDGALKHKHIEHTSASNLEDTLESLNTFVSAEEEFNSHQGEHSVKTYGHPELARLIDSKENNGKAIQIYEYSTTGTAPLCDRILNLEYNQDNHEAFEFNKIIAVNGEEHNIISDGYVRNQKMILAARMSTEGTWDGSPSKWVEHTGKFDLESAQKQLVLYTQNTVHKAHIPENNQNLKMSKRADIKDFTKSIEDTMGESWNRVYPLELLYDELNSQHLMHSNLSPLLAGTSKRDANNTVKCTVEDIGTYVDANGFRCFYGTIKLNLWLNICFAITLKSDQDEPYIQFFNIEQTSRANAYKAAEEILADKISAGKSLFAKLPTMKKLDDKVFAHLCDSKSFGDMFNEKGLRQTFRPIFNAQSNNGVALTFAFVLDSFAPRGQSKVDGLATYYGAVVPKEMDFIYSSNVTISYDVTRYSSGYKYENQIFYKFDARHCSLPGTCFDSTLMDIHAKIGPEIRTALFPEFNNLSKTNKNTSNLGALFDSRFDKVRIIHSDLSKGECCATTWLERRISAQDSRGTSYTWSCKSQRSSENVQDMFTNKKINIAVNNIVSSKFVVSDNKAIRRIVHIQDGSIYIFKQLVNHIEEGIYDPVFDENDMPLFDTEVLIAANSIQRVLPWTNCVNDIEFICLENDNTNDQKKEDQKCSYYFYSQNYLDDSWSKLKLLGSVATDRSHIEEGNIEKAQVFDLVLQGENIYNKPVSLSEDEFFEIRLGQPTYVENFTTGPNKGEGFYVSGPQNSIFIKPNSLGRALLQVKPGLMDAFAGILLSYRIVKASDFSRVNGAKLALDPSVEEIYSFRQINLAYKLHNRFERDVNQDLSKNKNGKEGTVLNTVFNNLESDYQNQGAQSQIHDGLKQFADKITVASKNNSTVSAMIPDLNYRNEQPLVCVNPLKTNQYAIVNGTVVNQSNLKMGWLSKAWKKLCNAAIAVINKVKEAINWVVEKLDEILQMVVDLGIPVISDIAKVAQGALAFVGSVVNTVLDIAVMIIEVLKYIFDFEEARLIGKEITTAISSMLKGLRSNTSSNSTRKQQGLNIDHDINKLLSEVDMSNLEKLDSENKSNLDSIDNISQAEIETNEESDNADYVENLINKNSSDEDLNDLNDELKFIDDVSPIKNEISSVLDTKTQNEITEFSQNILTSFSASTEVKTSDIASRTKSNGFDFDKIIEPVINAVQNFSQAALNGMSQTFEAFEKIKLPKVLSWVFDNILGVKIDNFKDILDLIIGYPIMLAQAIINQILIKLNQPEVDIKSILSILNETNTRKLASLSQDVWKKTSWVNFIQILRISCGAFTVISSSFKAIDALEGDYGKWCSLLKWSIKAPSILVDILDAADRKVNLEKFVPYVTSQMSEELRESEDSMLMIMLPTLLMPGVGFVIGGSAVWISEAISAYGTTKGNHFPELLEPEIHHVHNCQTVAGYISATNFLLTMVRLFDSKLPSVYKNRIFPIISIILKAVNLILNIIIASTIKNKNFAKHQLNMYLAKNILGDLYSISDEVFYLTNENYEALAINTGVNCLLGYAICGLDIAILATDENS
ncbi:hypothetical protein OAO18_00940 [Francisellaceae bacterium]|nr:hypothetical protein [Francisellaceae bacterium]